MRKRRHKRIHPQTSSQTRIWHSIQLPLVNDLHQKIPSFQHCEDYGIHRASNPNPLQDDTRMNDNELHQQI